MVEILEVSGTTAGATVEDSETIGAASVEDSATTGTASVEAGANAVDVAGSVVAGVLVGAAPASSAEVVEIGQ